MFLKIKPRKLLTQVFIPLLSIIGLTFAIYFTTSMAAPKAQTTNQLAIPPGSPFTATVSGSGTVEANTRNISVGVFISGIIEHINVRVGDHVKAGQVLFEMDARQAEADFDLAVAGVDQAEAVLADTKDQLRRYEGLKVGLAVSQDTLSKQRFLVKKLEAELAASKAKAQLAEVRLAQQSVTAPVDGRILKINVSAGEFVNASSAAASGNNASIVMGGDDPLYVRVQIDENDIPRLKADAPAVAFLRSKGDIKFDLKLVRIEPLVLPKRSLTGDTSERVDTRVLEVIYELQNPSQFPVYIGQQMDIFIDASVK